MGQQERCCASGSLSRNGQCILRVKADLDSPLGGGSDRAQKESYPTGPQRCSRVHLFFVNDQGPPDRVEDRPGNLDGGIVFPIRRQASH